jgi:hypothetical protein
MRKAILLLAGLAGACAAAAGALAQAPQRDAAGAGEPAVRVAQGACWYAVLSCSTSRREAARWVDQHGVGRVINTSSDEFPNFRAGYYCAVEGPMSQSAAQRVVSRWRGVSPTAYAKSGC